MASAKVRGESVTALRVTSQDFKMLPSFFVIQDFKISRFQDLAIILVRDWRLRRGLHRDEPEADEHGEREGRGGARERAPRYCSSWEV